MGLRCFASLCNEAVNEDVNNVRNWLVDNKLILSKGKSKYTLIGGNKRVKDIENVALSIEGKELEVSESCHR